MRSRPPSEPRSRARRVRALQLDGLVDYAEGHALMEELVDRRFRGEVPDVLLLLEHAPVITVGRARGAPEHVLDPGGLPVVPVSRGGDVTLHGPGQLVCYPILALPEPRRDLIRHGDRCDGCGGRHLQGAGCGDGCRAAWPCEGASPQFKSKARKAL